MIAADEICKIVPSLCSISYTFWKLIRIWFHTWCFQEKNSTFWRKSVYGNCTSFKQIKSGGWNFFSTNSGESLPTFSLYMNSILWFANDRFVLLLCLADLMSWSSFYLVSCLSFCHKNLMIFEMTPSQNKI